MAKFQRIYWSKKFNWKNYSSIYNDYCFTRNNYYELSSFKIIDELNLSNSSKVIDLCCGTGALSRELLKKYPDMNILAVDLSKEMLLYYKRNFKENILNGQIKVINENAEDIDKYTSEKFDAIIISSALWDLEIEKTLKSLLKTLKKDGKIIFNLPALVIEKEKGFIFFIEQFFKKTLNSNIMYRRIKIDYLKKLFERYDYKLLMTKEYSFNMPKENISEFFNLLKYRYPFILFPKEMPYEEKLKRCEEIFKESLKYIPKEGIMEYGYIFIIQK